MTLKITDARAAELAALDKAATAGPWKFDEMRYVIGADYSPTLDTPMPGIDRDVEGALLRVRGHGAEASGHRPAGSQKANARVTVGARNALAALLADRATLLDALRRAEAALRIADRAVGGGDLDLPVYAPITAALADLRALLASAEGGRDG